jgi:hypothetical protein
MDILSEEFDLIRLPELERDSSKSTGICKPTLRDRKFALLTTTQPRRSMERRPMNDFGLAGPVIMAAKAALRQKDIRPVLKWVKPEAESEIRSAFAKMLSVRTKGAARLGRKLRWDPAKEQFLNDAAEANALLDRPMRAPWKLVT